MYISIASKLDIHIVYVCSHTYTHTTRILHAVNHAFILKLIHRVSLISGPFFSPSIYFLYVAPPSANLR